MTGSSLPQRLESLAGRRMSKIIQVITMTDIPGRQLCWQVEREPFSWREGEGGWPVYSRALVCPWCLRVWATLEVFGQTGFVIDSSPCEDCPQWHDLPPGSLLASQVCNGVDWGLITEMPEALLRREFELTLRAFS